MVRWVSTAVQSFRVAECQMLSSIENQSVVMAGLGQTGEYLLSVLWCSRSSADWAAVFGSSHRQPWDLNLAKGLVVEPQRRRTWTKWESSFDSLIGVKRAKPTIVLTRHRLRRNRAE